MGGQVHTRFLSPKVSSIRPTLKIFSADKNICDNDNVNVTYLGQSLASDLTKGAGKAASSLT